MLFLFHSLLHIQYFMGHIKCPEINLVFIEGDNVEIELSDIEIVIFIYFEGKDLDYHPGLW